MDRKNPVGEKPNKSQAELDAAKIRSHIIGNFNNFFRILEILEERKRELGFTPLHEEPHGKWFVGEDYVGLIEKHLTPIKEIMEAKGDSSTYKLVEFIGKVKATKGKQDGKDIYLIDTFDLETIKSIILAARNRYAPDPLAATGVRIKGRWITPADAPHPGEAADSVDKPAPGDSLVARGWKSIAKALDCSVRTAKTRYYTEKTLPLRHESGKKRPQVLLYQSGLDAYLAQNPPKKK